MGSAVSEILGHKHTDKQTSCYFSIFSKIWHYIYFFKNQLGQFDFNSYRILSYWFVAISKTLKKKNKVLKASKIKIEGLNQDEASPLSILFSGIWNLGGGGWRGSLKALSSYDARWLWICFLNSNLIPIAIYNCHSLIRKCCNFVLKCFI